MCWLAVRAPGLMDTEVNRWPIYTQEYLKQDSSFLSFLHLAKYETCNTQWRWAGKSCEFTSPISGAHLCLTLSKSPMTGQTCLSYSLFSFKGCILRVWDDSRD